MGYRDFAGTANCAQGDGLICLDQDEIAYTDAALKPNLILVGVETSNCSPGWKPCQTSSSAWWRTSRLQWTDYAPLAELQSVVHLAQRIGMVNRALTWHRVIAHLPDSLKSEYAMAVPANLQEFVNME